MAHWQDRFLGIGELPPELSIFEIDFFQFSAPDIAAIRKEFRPKYRIAVALQLGFMRLTGSRLNAINIVPRKLLNLVGEQIGASAPSIASLRSMYRRGNTRRDHLLGHAMAQYQGSYKAARANAFCRASRGQQGDRVHRSAHRLWKRRAIRHRC
jgi:hypothetical protein